VHVTPEGAVGHVQLQSSAGHAALDAAAMEAVRKWRFEPARSGPAAVAAWAVVRIRFSVGDR
jgi:protein TonB